MKKIAALVLVLAMMLSCAACSSQSGSTAQASGTGAKKLTVWCWDENFNIAAMNTAAEYYRAAGHEDFELEVVNTIEEDVRSKCVAALSAGVTDGMPDIILVGDNWAKNFLTNYEGCFVDLTDEIDFSEFASYKVSCLTVNDRVYGVPFDSGSAGLFYRIDILEDAGFTPEDLEDITWPEMIEIAKTVKAETGKYAFQFIPSECAFTWFDSAMQASGTWFYDENEDADFANNAVVREMFDVTKELWNNDLVYQTDVRDSTGIAAMQNGEIAFVLNAIWYAPTIMASEESAGLWGYTNVPLLTSVENPSKYTNIGGSSWVILESSANQELAIDFMKTIWAGNEDFYDQILREQAAVATWLPATESEVYNEPVAFFNDQPIYGDFARWGEMVPSIDYGTQTWTVNAAIQAHLQDYIDGNITLDEAMDLVQETYDQTR